MRHYADGPSDVHMLFLQPVKTTALSLN